MKEPIKTGRITPKVSQKTIDEIKKMGMKQALSMVKMYADQSRLKGKDAATTAGEGKKFLRGETAEGIRRLYGDRRYGSVTSAPKKKTTSSATGAYGKNNTPKYRPATAASVKTKKK